MEAKRNGVRVNCLSPSLVRNTRTWNLVFEAEFSKKLFAKAEAMANLGITDPEIRLKWWCIWPALRPHE